MRLVFFCFLEEIEVTKKTFRNYLTFSKDRILINLYIFKTMTFWANQNSALLVGKTVIGVKYGNFGAAQFWCLGPDCMFASLQKKGSCS
jgi:hypothetical protein